MGLVWDFLSQAVFDGTCRFFASASFKRWSHPLLRNAGMLSGLPTQGGSPGGRLPPVIFGIGVHDRPERAGRPDIASSGVYGVCIDGCRSAAARMRMVENEPRGARHCARILAPHPCIRLAPSWSRTMKQSFASAARLRGGGPILTNGSMTMFRLGSPPPRIVIG